MESDYVAVKLLPARLLEILVSIGKWANRKLLERRIADLLPLVPPPGQQPDPVFKATREADFTFTFTGL